MFFVPAVDKLDMRDRGEVDVRSPALIGRRPDNARWKWFDKLVFEDTE